MAGSTPVTLLEHLRRHADAGSWQRLHEIYSPLLRSWLKRQQLQDTDVDDLTQDVLKVVARRLPEFEHNGQAGAFRAWLRTILAYQLRAYWRQAQRVPLVGGEDVDKVLHALEDPASDLSRRWDEEHDRAITHRLLELIEPEFEPTTWRAFRRLVLDEAPIKTIAAELGMTPNAIRIAKSRVMRRLRQEIGDLID